MTGGEGTVSLLTAGFGKIRTQGSNLEPSGPGTPRAETGDSAREQAKRAERSAPSGRPISRNEREHERVAPHQVRIGFALFSEVMA